MSIEATFAGKDARERSQIKSREIAKVAPGTFEQGDYRIEPLSITEIEGGIQVLARAWHGGRQLGFGRDGTVDVERFRFINPPILVDDPDGEIVRDVKDGFGNPAQRRLTEAPARALREMLAHAVAMVGKKDRAIRAGSVGNTTTTVYPDAHAESTSVDGKVAYEGGTPWSTIRGSTTGTTASDSAGNEIFAGVVRDPGPIYYLRRGFLLFDTSSISATDTIDSATMTLRVIEKWGTADASSFVSLVASTPASNTALVIGDFDQLGTTKLAADVTLTNGYDGTDYDLTFTLNASGLAAVTGGGITKLGTRVGYDIANVEPGSSLTCQIFCNSADTTGTSTDPKLVVVHSAPATSNSRLLLLGVG